LLWNTLEEEAFANKRAQREAVGFRETSTIIAFAHDLPPKKSASIGVTNKSPSKFIMRRKHYF
jgi:hypothetical protein